MFPTPLETAQTGERFARTDASASALDAAVEFPRGSLDHLDAKGGAAAASDGVIHLASKQEESFLGDVATATDAGRRAIEVIGGLAGSDPAVDHRLQPGGAAAGALATRLEARRELPPARQEDGVLSAFKGAAPASGRGSGGPPGTVERLPLGWALTGAKADERGTSCDVLSSTPALYKTEKRTRHWSPTRATTASGSRPTSPEQA